MWKTEIAQPFWTDIVAIGIRCGTELYLRRSVYKRSSRNVMQYCGCCAEIYTILSRNLPRLCAFQLVYGKYHIGGSKKKRSYRNSCVFLRVKQRGNILPRHCYLRVKKNVSSPSFAWGAVTDRQSMTFPVPQIVVSLFRVPQSPENR